MKLYFRLLWLVLTQRYRARCPPIGPCKSHFRVLPNDLDLLMHVNNGVYLTLADLGRTDMLLRSDMFGEIRQRGWNPVAAATSIRYRRSLSLWQKFSIDTRVLGWQGRSVYIEQRFESGGKLVAHMVIDARFLSRSGERIDSNQLVDVMKLDGASPSLPPWVEQWAESVRLQSDAETRDAQNRDAENQDGDGRAG